MQPSIQTGPDNSSIEDLRFEKQALEKLVGEQRERIVGLERSARPERKGLWGRMFGSVAVLVLVVGLTQPLLASFHTGNDWLGQSEAQRNGYVAGAVDAFGTAADWESHNFAWMEECMITGWTLGQTRAVLEKYFADHPEERHMAASSRLHNALVEACK
jgi:hypothetical protein